MRLLNNLFKVAWCLKNADIICYILTSLVYLQQGNDKKLKKLMKVVDIDEENLHIFRKKDFGNFNKISRKNVPYDDIKSHKKPGLYPYSRKHSFRKTKEQEGVKLTVSTFWGLKLQDTRLFCWIF